MTITTIFLSFLLLLFGRANSESQLNDKEQTVLLKLKQHWQNPPSLSHWQNPLSLSHLNSLNSSHHCNWPEITCTSGTITQLRLQNKNITQTVPPFICDLKNLTAINLSFNFIPQEFPKALYNCSKLEELDLSQNYFNGTIPVDIHRLSGLRHLNLGANDFYGNIPASIGQLTELRTLKLFQCAFNGSFPPEIGNLSKLESLQLAYNVNMTAAELPSRFTELKKLKFLWIAASNLNGEIPEAIGEMEALEHLDLSKNNLTGKIPTSLFMPKNLRIVYLFINQLSGEIPRVVEALNIDVIDLSDNKLTGSIPDDFGRLRNMTGLSLFFNQLSGKIPDSIGRLPSLVVLKVFSNNLSGTLPPDFGRYSKLVEFQVADNKLEGELPEHLCDNRRLVGVVAFNNNLTGELPKSLGNCNGLKIVTVYNNRLSGDIPNGLWTSLNLSVLILSDNSFTGELPQRVARNLSRLEINNNNFFGSLPPDIISWKTLNTLNLRRNKISGPIPEKLGSLVGLTELDLSKNQLSGQIPLQLGLLKLTLLNLSSNHLTGRIPTQFENDAYANSFLNNLALCANKPSLNINSCNNSDHHKSSKVPSKYLPLIISFVVAALLRLVVAMINIYRKGKHRLDSTWKFTIFQSVNFRESDILSGLIEDNVIGSGGSGKVYRVVVNDPNNIVAVKRIGNNRKLEQKLEKEFHAEVKILGSIRHSNIVKLLCCMSNENSKLLVYEYSKNHSLDQWLHRKSRASSTSSSVQNVVLDWPKRLQIAVGAAQGLYHMHNSCSPPIVHRDVKSSNILLDSEFNAKIADFGLAKMFKQGELATMSVVAGSFGYIAPEYAHTMRVNEKIDVYSFGVILLELTTGREASYGDEHTSLAEWAWRYIKDDIPIVDALDEEIKEPSYLEEMSSVFILGIICTNKEPSKRPSMKEVMQKLHKCSQPLVYGEKIATGLSDTSPLKNSKRKSASENDEEILASIV
ncbi:hypothetical protein ACB098_01G173000 [Castanea mollissima]